MMYPPPSILIVANSSLRIRKLKRILENNGCDVYRIGIGFDDLAIVRQKYFDLIVLDLEQATVNGFEICRKFETEPELVGIPLVLRTTYNQAKEVITESKKIHSPVYCLAKNAFSVEMLLQIIEQTRYLTDRYL